jgi:hypothetical protein
MFCLCSASAAAQTEQPAGTAERKAAARRGAIKALDYLASIRQTVDGGGRFGGWAGSYSENLSRRGGEANQALPADVIRTQPCATPNVGHIFLRAGLVLKEERYLQLARSTADTLMAAQTSHGGWNFEIWLSPQGPKPIHVYPGRTDWSKRQPAAREIGTLDDDTSFAPAEFLYTMWRTTKEERYRQGWLKAMDFVLTCQLPNGGYRQSFPSSGYHGHATFNDGAMRGAVRVMLLAYQRTGDDKYLNSARKCGEFLIRCQTPEGGYGAQHTDEGAIASARSFEPPGLGPDATTDAILILTQLYDWTGEVGYLAPLRKAADWLKNVQLGDGRWARFYHPGTGKPWYISADGGEVATAQEARGGYAWEGSWGNAGIAAAMTYSAKGPGQPRQVPSGGDPDAELKIRGGGIGGFQGAGKIPQRVEDILKSQDELGRWMDRRGIRIAQFVVCVDRLLDFLEGQTNQD